MEFPPSVSCKLYWKENSGIMMVVLAQTLGSGMLLWDRLHWQYIYHTQLLEAD